MGDEAPRFARRLQIRLSRGAIAYSKPDAAQFKGILGPRPVVTAPNASESVHSIGVAPIDTVRSDFLYVGRLIADKKVDLLVRGFAEAVTRGLPAQARLVVVGSGPELPRLRDLAGAIGVIDRVSFEDETYSSNDLDLLYAHAVAGVCGGYVGLNLIQSLVRGVPFVFPVKAAHSPEVSLAVPGGNSFTFEPADEFALADSLLEVWDMTTRGSVDHSFIQTAALATNSIEGMIDGFVQIIDAFVANTTQVDE